LFRLALDVVFDRVDDGCIDKMKRIAVLLALAGLIALSASGCRLLTEADENAVDQLPWNTPATWEGQIIGVPY